MEERNEECDGFISVIKRALRLGFLVKLNEYFLIGGWLIRLFSFKSCDLRKKMKLTIFMVDEELILHCIYRGL